MMIKFSVKWLWFVILVWFGLSCYGLFLRVPSGHVSSVSHLDKVAHFVMFLGSFVCYRSYLKSIPKPKRSTCGA